MYIWCEYAACFPSSLSPRSLCHAGHEADGASGETGPSELPYDGKKENTISISPSGSVIVCARYLAISRFTFNKRVC